MPRVIDRTPGNVPQDRIAELEDELRRLKQQASTTPRVQPMAHGDKTRQYGPAAPRVKESDAPVPEGLPEGFAVFTGRHRPAGGAIPRMAFQRRGNLSLNRAAFEALGSPEAVVLAYNEGAGEVAIKGASKSLAYASPVRKQQAADSYLVAARAFTQSIRLDLEGSMVVFDEVRVAPDGFLIVNVEEGRRILTRRRKS